MTYNLLVNIASIHATILSIIITAISAYVIYIYTNLDKRKLKVIFEAERINRELSFGYVDYNSSSEILLASDINNRNQLITKLDNLGACNYNDSEAAGKEAFKIMNALSLFYPFPQRAMIENGNIKNIREPISFNIDMVQQWILDMWFMTNFLRNLDRLKKILSIYSKIALKEINDVFNIDIIESFISNFIKARDIAASTGLYLAEYNSYKRRLPKKALVIIWLIYAGVAFVSGVFLPIFNISKYQIFLIWIPLSFYAVNFLIIINTIRKI